MNAKPSRNRRTASVRNLPTNSTRLVCVLFALAFAGEIFAAEVTETRVTALLPESTQVLDFGKAVEPNSGNPLKNPPVLTVSGKFQKQAQMATYLQFSAESLPPDATIVKAALRLVQQGKQPNFTALTMRLVSVQSLDWAKKENLDKFENDDKFVEASFESAEADNNTVDSVAWTMQCKVSEAVADNVPPKPAFLRKTGDHKKYIALLLLPPQVATTGRAFSPVSSGGANAGGANADLGNQPRLILTYTVPRSTTPRSPDLQSDGWAAMRSPRAFMPVPNAPAQDKYAVLPVVDGTKTFSYTAAVYGGLTYVVRQDANKQNNVSVWHLDAQEPLGNVVWNKPLPSPVGEKARLVVNDSGRLTIVSQNRFLVYQLNTSAPRQQPAQPLKPATLPGVTKPQALLAGPDGSLYVIDDTDVYALNPDLQMLWRTSVGTSASARVTLSPDGRFVYVVSVWPAGGNKSGVKEAGLLAINAQTGKAPERLLFDNATKSFHRPLVVKHPDGADYIYIAAHSQNGGVLRTVKNTAKGHDGDRIAVLDPVSEEAGFFSQPAADATVPKGDLKTKRVYAVWRENQQSSVVRLVTINGQSGKIENPAAPALKDSQGNDASFEAGSWLWDGGNLAMDQNNNVFFWENGTLYGCGADIKPLACPVNKGLPKDKQLPTELELLFGTDGTLYAQDSSNGALSALIPTYTFPMTQGNISSPTHLRVGGKADRATTLSAHGSVLLRKGFTVKKGASLTIKTEQP